MSLFVLMCKPTCPQCWSESFETDFNQLQQICSDTGQLCTSELHCYSCLCLISADMSHVYEKEMTQLPIYD